MDDKRFTILLASEYPKEIGVLVPALTSAGFRVLTVADRATIVTLARSEVLSLILLDLNSCFDVCRILKRSFVTEPIPIIAILFPADEVDRVAVLELGADDCVAKPYNFRELSLRIRASLIRTRDKQGRARYRQSQYYSALVQPSARKKIKKG